MMNKTILLSSLLIFAIPAFAADNLEEPATTGLKQEKVTEKAQHRVDEANQRKDERGETANNMLDRRSKRADYRGDTERAERYDKAGDAAQDYADKKGDRDQRRLERQMEKHQKN